MHIVAGAPNARQVNRIAIGWIAVLLTSLSAVMLVVYAVTFGPAWWAYRSYVPQEGDVIFQSLPHSRLVSAIEGATRSPFSHCGIVARENGRWVVWEALAPVSPTPLGEFIGRGRNGAFAVKRLKSEHQSHVPAILTNVRKLRGRPYDERYRLDDDGQAIYCSELIYVAYRAALPGETLGKLVTLGELKWQPYEALIEQIEKAPPPLNREIITPRDLARAKQFEPAYSFGY
jgi:hypothetical protein